MFKIFLIIEMKFILGNRHQVQGFVVTPLEPGYLKNSVNFRIENVIWYQSFNAAVKPKLSPMNEMILGVTWYLNLKFLTFSPFHLYVQMHSLPLEMADLCNIVATGSGQISP